MILAVFLKRYLCNKRGRPDLYAIPVECSNCLFIYFFIYLFIYMRGLRFDPSKWQINDFHVSTWLACINITRMLHMHCSSKFHSTYLNGFLLTLFKINRRSKQCCVYTNNNYSVDVIQYRPRFLRCWQHIWTIRKFTHVLEHNHSIVRTPMKRTWNSNRFVLMINLNKCTNTSTDVTHSGSLVSCLRS